jgi:hypothetical protein
MVESMASRHIAVMQQSTRTMDLEILSPTERDEVERWRTGELERAGFDASLARALAPRFDIDLHVAVDLIAKGCPPKLAARILL